MAVSEEYASALREIERLTAELEQATGRADANADHARLANRNRDESASALKVAQARNEALEKVYEAAKAVAEDGEFPVTTPSLKALDEALDAVQRGGWK